jgi:hypothetical protein
MTGATIAAQKRPAAKRLQKIPCVGTDFREKLGHRAVASPLGTMAGPGAWE